MGVQERAKDRERIDKDKTIKNQADVIKEMWSELQQLKRILIDEGVSIAVGSGVGVRRFESSARH